MTARISLPQDCFKLETAEHPELSQGVHSIFFLNILGFEEGQDFTGYVTPCPPSKCHLIFETLKYLKEQNISTTLDSVVEDIVSRLQADTNELMKARQLGTKLKRSPVHTISIPNLKRPLKPYQVPAVAFMSEMKNAANFSVPGSGKTAVLLASYALAKSQGKIEKLLVIGPRACFLPWEEEYAACFDHAADSVRIVGPRHSRSKLYRLAEGKELILLTYQMVTNDVDDVISFLREHKVMVVLDESHNIKRLEGGKWSTTVLTISPYAARRAVLSGTPMPNSIQDIWSQVTFLWPNSPALGTKEEFRARTGDADKKGVSDVREELSPLYWRVRKKDLELPPPKFHRIKVRMGKYQNSIYQALANKVLSDVVKAPEERAKLRLWRRARMVRLLQAASNPSLLIEHSTEFQIPPIDASGLPVDQLIEQYSRYEKPNKLACVIDLAKELIKKKKKVLIWSVFIHNIKTLEKELSTFHPRIVFGDVPKDDSEDEQYNREKMIEDFKTSSQFPVLIANPSACAESVSLHKICTDAIYVERTFNGAQYMQSLDRIHRVGLDRNDRVNYYIVQSNDTVDEIIDERLNNKQKRMLGLLNDDVSILNLDSAVEEFSEEKEGDSDFKALIAYLKSKSYVVSK